MKRLALLGTLLLAVAVTRADDTPERHRGKGRVYDSEARISIVPPAGWSSFQGDKSHRLTFEGPAGQGGNMNVLVIPQENKSEPDQLRKVVKEMLAGSLKEWKCVDDGVVEIDGSKGYFIVSRFIAEDGKRSVELQNVQYFLPAHRGKTFVLTFTTVPSKFEKLSKLFKDSALSFRGD